MGIEEIVKSVEDEAKRRIEEIFENAKKERDTMIANAKVKIDQEFEEMSAKLMEEYKSKISSQKIQFESEVVRKINEKFTSAFNSLFPEVEKMVKRMILSNEHYPSLVIKLLELSLESLGYNKDGEFMVYISKNDEHLEKKLLNYLDSKDIKAKIKVSDDIEGGVVSSLGKIKIDNSISRLVKNLRYKIVKTLYYHILPR